MIGQRNGSLGERGKNSPESDRLGLRAQKKWTLKMATVVFILRVSNVHVHSIHACIVACVECLQNLLDSQRKDA